MRGPLELAPPTQLSVPKAHRVVVCARTPPASPPAASFCAGRPPVVCALSSGWPFGLLLLAAVRMLL